MVWVMKVTHQRNPHGSAVGAIMRASDVIPSGSTLEDVTMDAHHVVVAEVAPATGVHVIGLSGFHIGGTFRPARTEELAGAGGMVNPDVGGGAIAWGTLGWVSTPGGTRPDSRFWIGALVPTRIAAGGGGGS